MGFAWKFLFPVAVFNLLITGLMVALFYLTWTSFCSSSSR